MRDLVLLIEALEMHRNGTGAIFLDAGAESVAQAVMEGFPVAADPVPSELAHLGHLQWNGSFSDGAVLAVLGKSGRAAAAIDAAVPVIHLMGPGIEAASIQALDAAGYGIMAMVYEDDPVLGAPVLTAVEPLHPGIAFQRASVTGFADQAALERFLMAGRVYCRQERRIASLQASNAIRGDQLAMTERAMMTLQGRVAGKSSR